MKARIATLGVLYILAIKNVGAAGMGEIKFHEGSLMLCLSGQCSEISAPPEFLEDYSHGYDHLLWKDVDMNGEYELLAGFSEQSMRNNCSMVYRFDKISRELKSHEVFKEGLCDYRYEEGVLVNKYYNEAKWNEEVYDLQGAKPVLIVIDRCVGCGEIQRTAFTPQGIEQHATVSDAVNYVDRVPLLEATP